MYYVHTFRGLSQILNAMYSAVRTGLLVLLHFFKAQAISVHIEIVFDWASGLCRYICWNRSVVIFILLILVL